jgi:PA domain
LVPPQQKQIPSSLTVATSGGYEHRAALFGTFPFGGKIQQKVYYANTTLCDADEVAFGRLNSYPKSGATESPESTWDPPFILMVDRGSCTFVHKVRNGQKAGAAAVLIADNICMCMHLKDGCQMPPDQDQCETTEPFMSDDGSGADISIPAFLLFKTDADAIKSTLVGRNQPVVAELSFSIPNPDGHVEYDVWTSPGDPVSREWINTFQSAAMAFSSHAKFTPHMDIIDGVLNNCGSPSDNDPENIMANICEGLCTNHGRYCALDPDGDLAVGASGSDVVVESLRQLCIWQVYGGTDDIGVEWWKYAKTFAMECAYDPTGVLKEGEKFANAKCITNALDLAGIDPVKIEKCIADTGGLDGDVVNTLLEQQLLEKTKDGMIVLPTLFVNNAPVRGAFDYQNAFRAICNGFAAGSGPDICEVCDRCHDVVSCVAKGGQCDDAVGPMGIAVSGSGISHTTFFASIVALVSCFGIVGYVLHRRQQRYMHDQIRGIMAEYMPVDPYVCILVLFAT